MTNTQIKKLDNYAKELGYKKVRGYIGWYKRVSPSFSAIIELKNEELIPSAGSVYVALPKELKGKLEEAKEVAEQDIEMLLESI